ncbi:MAG: hypothetical protein HOV86_20315 [Thermoactinospora sp.]|nr:hypothetical protein [Thermoactinospora sp.]
MTVAPMIVLLFAALILVIGVLAVVFAGLGSTEPPGPAPGAAGPTVLATVPWMRGNDPTALRTLIVGKDIEPGTYTSRGGYADPDHRCTWARVRGFSGQRGDVIQSGTSAGPVTVTIQATDKGFVTGWCGEWVSG